MASGDREKHTGVHHRTMKRQLQIRNAAVLFRASTTVAKKQARDSSQRARLTSPWLRLPNDERAFFEGSFPRHRAGSRGEPRPAKCIGTAGDPAYTLTSWSSVLAASQAQRTKNARLSRLDLPAPWAGLVGGCQRS